MAMLSATTRRGAWRPALAAGVAGALASMALWPYAAALSPALLARISIPLPLFLGLQLLQALVLFTLLGWAGCRLAQAAGLRAFDRTAPDWPGVTSRPAIFSLRRQGVSASLALGCLTGLTLLALATLTAPLMPSAINASTIHIALWKRLAASFYGGIAEELLCRLFLMSLLVWLARRCLRQDAALTATAAWIGIVGAALLFGVGHVPAAAAQWPLTTMVVLRTVVLNAAGGIVFGWLYWRRGLAHAMVAHFMADIVLHGIGGA